MFFFLGGQAFTPPLLGHLKETFFAASPKYRENFFPNKESRFKRFFLSARMKRLGVDIYCGIDFYENTPMHFLLSQL